MPNIAVNDILEWSIHTRLYGQVCISVFHYYCAGVGAVAEYNLAMDEWNNFITADSLMVKYREMTTVDLNFEFVRAQVVAPARQVLHDKGITGTGTNNAPVNISNTGMAITKRTAWAGQHKKDVHTDRGGIGTLHIPSVDSAQIDKSMAKPTMLIKMNAFGDQMILPKVTPGGTSWIPCIWHRKLTGPTSFDQLIGYLAQPQVRDMRRRTVGLGI